MSQIAKSVSRYQQALVEVDGARKSWPVFRDMVRGELMRLAAESSLYMEVEVDDLVTHRGSIIASLGRRDSPFQFNPESLFNRAMKNDQILKKEFGKLILAQQSNGRVAAWMQFPFCEGVRDAEGPEGRELGSWPIAQWDVEHVARVLNDFLDAITDWELGAQERPEPVGFRFPGHRDSGSGAASEEA